MIIIHIVLKKNSLTVGEIFNTLIVYARTIGEVDNLRRYFTILASIQ